MPTLTDAITAIKSGRKDEGRLMLTRILAQDGNNVTALLWMTEVDTTPEKRRIYLKRVLAIDPNNAPARRGLEILGPVAQPMTETLQQKPPEGTDQTPTWNARLRANTTPGVVEAGHTQTQQPSQPTATTATSAGPSMRPKYIVLFGGIVMILGSLLPWGTISSALSTYNHMDTDADGKFTLVIGVIVVIVALVSKETPGENGSALAGMLSLLVGALGVLDLMRISVITGYESGGVISVGAGMYVLVSGAIIGVIGGMMRNPEATPTR